MRRWTSKLTAGEICDDSGESEACDADCSPAECGDGLLNTTAGETCDDAGESEACDADCSIAECGDGYLNPLSGETCDDAGDSAATRTAVSMCGDGYTNPEAGEECDSLTTASPTARSESAAVTPPPHGKSSLNPCTTTTQQAPSPTSLTTSSMATGPHPYRVHLAFNHAIRALCRRRDRIPRLLSTGLLGRRSHPAGRLRVSRQRHRRSLLPRPGHPTDTEERGLLFFNRARLSNGSTRHGGTHLGTHAFPHSEDIPPRP